MTCTIAVLDVLAEGRLNQMRALLPEGFTLIGGKAPGDAAMQELIADVDFAISGQVGVSGDVLKAAKRLKLLHKWGVGVDNIDVEGRPARSASGWRARPPATRFPWPNSPSA